MLFRLLADGEWHNYQTVKFAIAATVPPGRALRKYQERLRQTRELRRDPNTEIYRSDDEQIRLGAAACAQITMTSWRGKGIIVRGEGPDKEVKVKPGFKTWGLENAAGEGQDPGKEPEGYTDLPPRDSEPSETSALPAEEASEPEPEPQSAPEPDPEPVSEPAAEPAMAELDALTVMQQPAPTDSVLLTGPEPTQWVPPAGSPFAAPAPERSTTEATAEPIEAIPEPTEGSSQYVTNVPVQICPECTMAVVDLAEHERWHAELKASNAGKELALVDKEMLVTLVGDVMRQALEDFQVGMQDWIEERFAEVERQIFALRGTRTERTSWAQRP
jgi:hypothetical protein